MPTVSIVVPAYNPGPMLRRALDSIIAQTFGDWECVVVDDGSDEALEWVTGVDPRVRLVRQPNAGVAAARNRGIGATSGGLVAFCDHDDEWLPPKLERQVAAISGHGLCYTAFERIDADGSRIGSGYSGADGYGDLLTGNGICTSTVMVRRDVLGAGFDTGLVVGEDWDLWLRIARDHPITRVNEVLVRYTEHPDQASRDYQALWRDARTVLDRHEHPNAAVGRRRLRELSGVQAFDRARETRRVRHLAFAVTHAPAYTGHQVARWLLSRVPVSHGQWPPPAPAGSQKQRGRVKNAPPVRTRTRVAILGHTAELGGAELGLVRVLDAVKDPRIEVRVVLFADGPLVGRLRESGHDVEVLTLDRRVARQTRHEAGRSVLSVIRVVVLLVPFVLRLTRRLRALDVDVIHANTLKADLVGVPVALLARRPLVWWVHDRIDPDYLPGATVRLVRFLARRFPCVVVANSEATAATLPGARGLIVVYPGVAPEEIGAPERPRPVGPAVVGIVGRISDTKGQLEFVRAAETVARVHPETRFRIVGSAMFGQQDYEARVRGEVIRLGLADVVEFTGFVDDPVAEIDQFAVCVHASGTPEPFGQVITEAMVRGVPVVATRGGGVTEILEPPDMVAPLGHMVPPGDVDALACAVLEILENPESARLRADEARTWAADQFAIARTANALVSLWASCAGHLVS